MELVAITATLILLCTFLTLFVSIAAYFVTRARNVMAKRRKKVVETAPEKTQLNRIYFERFALQPQTELEVAESSSGTDEKWI